MQGKGLEIVDFATRALHVQSSYPELNPICAPVGDEDHSHYPVIEGIRFNDVNAKTNNEK